MPGSIHIALLGLLSPAAFAQDPAVSAQDKKPERQTVDGSTCRQALVGLSKRHGKAGRITGTYRQERTTALLKRPLVSHGTLALRREPACLVFRTEGRQPTTIRMTHDLYEVYRAKHKTLERTPIADRSLPDALFQAFAPRLESLEAAFTIASAFRQGDELEIRLRPKDAASEFVRDVTIVLDEKRHELRRVAYRDPQGDRVTLVLSELRLDPELPKDAFDLVVPEGTKVLVHEPLRRKQKTGKAPERRQS